MGWVLAKLDERERVAIGLSRLGEISIGIDGFLVRWDLKRGASTFSW